MVAQFMPNIFINIILHGKEKYNKAISKVVAIISKLVLDQYQPIIKGKTLHEAWIALQERF